ncbi:MAG TPA: XrtA system polysaccharide deacetylase [Caldimonas sp.]|nr:XrtA system polysaccharide deacetylase [Caldimonas sp.]
MIDTTMMPIRNAMTVDVEDYFQVSALAPHIERATWDARVCRVEHNVDRLLSLFSDRGARATFFVLGWIAERHPQVVRRIAAAGHEVASHGYEHRRCTEMTRAELAGDVSRAKRLLEDLTGEAVNGYRAPSFSIGTANPWAFDVLLEAGHRYSSSVYPISHDHYGMPDAPRFPYEARPGLREIPIATVKCLGRNIPAGGGGYFRLAPYAVSRWAVRRINEVDHRPAIFYVHPWELDPGQPRIAGTSIKTRFRHYVNLHKTESRLDRLLRDFRWGRMDDVFGLRT